MTNPVANMTEWKTYRSALRAELLALQNKTLKPGIRRDAWTPRQVLHHVLLVEASSADLMERLAAKAGTVPERNPAEPWPIRAELMDFPLDTAFSVPAFKGTEPKADVSDKILKDLQADVLARHEALAQKAQRWQYDTVSFPHPLAGRLNFYEWLVFDGIHESLHLRQLKQDVE
jgi:hypothetical protein